jgi:hypothetical protein
MFGSLVPSKSEMRRASKPQDSNWWQNADEY